MDKKHQFIFSGVIGLIIIILIILIPRKNKVINKDDSEINTLRNELKEKSKKLMQLNRENLKLKVPIKDKENGSNEKSKSSENGVNEQPKPIDNPTE